MTHATRALTAAVFLSTALAGCKLVDLDKVQHYGCADGVCPDSSGGGAGGGAGTTGGGTGVTGGGGGDTCGPFTCPSGCCNGNTCVTGNAQSACGRAGQQCSACGTGETCVDGACSGCLATCAAGCCTGSTCQTRGPLTCGANNGVCMSCGLTADGCTEQGTCACGAREACSAGQHCVAGACQCDETSCPDGCCSPAGFCVKPTQQSAAQCGLGGDQCRSCTRPTPPACSPTVSNVRDTPTTPGSCALGVCEYPITQYACVTACDPATNNCPGDACQGCLTPPQPVCLGATLRTWANRGSCNGEQGCTYLNSDTLCTFGCADGECKTNPCIGVSCDAAQAPRCVNGNSIATALPGTCNVTGASHECTYGDEVTQCQFGCDDQTGLCRIDPCAGSLCTQPPDAPSCPNPSTRRVWLSPGACSPADAGCTYAAQDIACANGCLNGACQGADPCAGVTCNAPPMPLCLDGSTRRTFEASGACNAEGYCAYPPHDTQCAFGCANGACRPDPCSNITCESPPGDTCATTSTLRSYTASGTCTGGVCSYAFQDSSCTSAPAPSCVGDGGTMLRTSSGGGSCVNGGCQYTTTDSLCPAGCANGACNPDPCQGVSCNATPAATCANGTTRKVFGGSGYCQGDGGCNYPSTDLPCTTPSPPSCVTGTVLRTHNPSGTCAEGLCEYTYSDTTCQNGCTNNACVGDPCAGVTCTLPADTCANGTTRRDYTAAGTCSGGTCGAAAYTDVPCNTPPNNVCEGSSLRTYTTAGTCGGGGVCSYSSSLSACQFGCANGQCNADPCAGVSCTTAPPDDCYNGTTRRTYSTPGTCNGGACGNFPSTNVACNTPPGATCNGNARRTFSAAGTCSGAGVCSYAPIDTNCNTPPTTTSCNGNNLVSYVAQGTCDTSTVQCTYTTQETLCAFGCSGGQCVNDPCNGVSCVSPPQTDCLGSSQRVYTSPGTCSGGSCDYGYTLNACRNGCSNGACLPCNSSTCATGCCTTQTVTGSCRPRDVWCQGTSGNICSTGCSGGRYCSDGICVCDFVRANDPQKAAASEPESEQSAAPICNPCVHSAICP